MTPHPEPLSKDIVERLRIRQPLLGTLCDEAADEIERLRLYIKDLQINSPAEAALDEIERLRAALQEIYETARLAHEEARDEIERLREVRESEGCEIERLRNDYSILKSDYDALRADNEQLRTTLGYLADNINEPALVAVAEAALKPKP